MIVNTLAQTADLVPFVAQDGDDEPRCLCDFSAAHCRCAWPLNGIVRRAVRIVAAPSSIPSDDLFSLDNLDDLPF